MRDTFQLIVFATLTTAIHGVCNADSFLVLPDGTGDFATIADAVEAAVDGDVIELGDGVFSGTGNRDVNYDGKAITIRSLSGDPGECVIACEGDADDPHRGFLFVSGEGAASVLEGVTVQGGHAGAGAVFPEGLGGAITCFFAGPTILNCEFRENEARIGGAVSLLFGLGVETLRMVDCVVAGNFAENIGGGISASGSRIELVQTTVANNRAGAGSGGGVLLQSSTLSVERSIVWGNCATGQGAELLVSDSDATVVCSIVNTDGVDVFVGNVTYSGVFDMDPLFCQPSDCSAAPSKLGDYTVSVNSPAAAENNSCGVFIGARSVACGTIPTIVTSWGALKGRFKVGEVAPPE